MSWCIETKNLNYHYRGGVQLLVQLFLLFNVGIYLCGIIPAIFHHLPYSKDPFPFLSFLKGNGEFFIACLPVVAVQYAISLMSRNFLIPVGVGMGLYVIGMFMLKPKQSIWIAFMPYSYCALQFGWKGTYPLKALAAGYFVLFTILGYIVYISKKDKS